MNKTLIGYLTLSPFRSFFKKMPFSRLLLGAVTGIVFSFIPFVLVTHVTDGMISGILNRLIETTSYHLRAEPLVPLDEEQWQEALTLMKKTEGVRSAVIEQTGTGLIKKPGTKGESPVSVRGIDPELYRRDPGFRRYLRVLDGRFDLSSPRDILLGEAVARERDLHVGDSVHLLIGRTTEGGRFVPRIYRLKLRGIVSAGYRELDKTWLFMPEAEAARFFRDQNRFVGLKVKRSPYGSLEDIAGRLREALPPYWTVRSWKRRYLSQQSNYASTKAVLGLIAALIVLVAVFNGSSGLAMLVIEKSPEIAVLKSLGASGGDITAAFTLIGMTAGGVGSFLGLVLGVLVTLGINEIIRGIEFVLNVFLHLFHPESSIHLLNRAYYLETIPIHLNIHLLLTAWVAAVLTAGAASWIPARRAGRIRPAELLRRY